MIEEKKRFGYHKSITLRRCCRDSILKMLKQ